LGVVATACLAGTLSLTATELLQNNSFDQGSNLWHVTSAAGSLNLFAVTGQVNLHISGYIGNVISQDLALTNAGGAYGSASITLRKNTTTLATSNTIAVYVTYTDDTGQTNRLLLFKPANADMAAGGITNLSTTVTLPANARSVVRYDIDKIYFAGNYDAFEVSLDLTIPLPVNPVVSKWFQILSTNAPGDQTLWLDAYNQVVTVGDTVHVAWIRSDVNTTYYEKLCYRRSLDGGKTFEPTLVLEQDVTGLRRLSGAMSQESFTPQYLAADGTNVHVAISSQCEAGKGILYYHSTNAGAAFQPRRLLNSLNFDEWAGPAWVTAGNGKVTIVFMHLWTVYVTDPIPGQFGRAAPDGLNSQDNGNTFGGAYVGPFIESMGVFIGDVKQSGDTVAVAWRHTDTQPFLHGGFVRVAVSTNGGASFPGLHDPHGGYEGEFFCQNIRLAVDAPNVYALWGACTNYSVNGAPPELFFARSIDNGASFGAPLRLSTPSQPYTDGCGVWSTVAARGSNVYAMSYSANQVLFHVSHDQGATFAPARDLASGGSTLKPTGEPLAPILIVDPASADGRSFHALWCGDQYTRSDDGGQTFSPPVHLCTYWTLPYWASPPQAAVANAHAFLLTLSCDYWRNDDDVLFRRYAAAPQPASTNLGLHMEYFWDYPNSPVDQQRMDNLQVPAVPALQFSNACTVEMWIRCTDIDSAPYFLYADSEASSSPLALYILAGGWGAGPEDRWFGAEITTQNGTLVNLNGSGERVRSNVWHHAAMTYDAAAGTNNLCLYVDGHLNASTTATGLLARVTGPIWVGYGNAYATFSGDLDDLRFWNRARTAQEIRDNFTGPLLGTEPGLVAYYPLDGTTMEVTGHGRDGVLMYKESFGVGADVLPVLRLDSFTPTQVTLSWITFDATYRVQATESLATPDWQPVPGTPAQVEGRWTQTVTTTGNAMFYRLLPQ
jgi:hypothetical protein